MVAEREAVNDGDGLVLTALVEEELGRFEEVEDEEPNDEHGKGDDANGDDKIPPALLNRPVRDEVPCNERRDELADGPPHGEEGQQGAGGVGEELEEQGAVDRQTAADAEAKSAEEEADGPPALRVGGHDAEDAGDEERRVEGDAAPEEVGANAPEEAARREADEEGARRVSDCLLVDAELG